MSPARAELLTVVVERRGRDVIVRAAGELDLSTAPQLYDALRRAGEDASARLILELGQLTFIDASGLSAIARVSHELGERFTLAPPPPFVRRVLAIAG
jgi:anti-sigma B factor antagonist